MSKSHPKKVEFRQLTPNSAPQLSIESGIPEEDLLRYYHSAVKDGTSAVVLISAHPMSVKREIAAAYAMGKCYYERASEHTDEFICIIHDQISKHNVNESSRLPCVALDPWEKR